MKIKKKYLYIIVVFLFLLALVLLPVLLDKFVFGNDIQSNLTNGEWAGFLGSYFGGIIGGMASMLGIYMTIKTSDRRREEELELQYRPVLLPNIEKYSDDMNFLGYELNYTFKHPYLNDYKNNYCLLTFVNVGRSEIVDIEVDIETFGEQNIPSLQAYILFKGVSDSYIPIGGKVQFILCIPSIRAEKKEIFFGNHERVFLSSILQIRYKGIFGKNVYVQRLHYNIGISEVEQPFHIWIVNNRLMEEKLKQKEAK